MIVPISHFVITKNQSALFLKKNPNLARIPTWATNLKHHYSFLLLTNIHAFAEKGPRCTKISSKLNVKLIAQISDSFKKLN